MAEVDSIAVFKIRGMTCASRDLQDEAQVPDTSFIIK